MFELLPDQEQELNNVLRTTDNEAVRQRVQAVLFYYQGYPLEYLQQQLHVNPADLQKWLRGYAVEGISALTKQKRRKPAPIVMSDSIRHIAQEALRTPPATDEWTVELLRFHIAMKTEAVLPIPAVRQLVEELGYKVQKVHRILR